MNMVRAMENLLRASGEAAGVLDSYLNGSGPTVEELDRVLTNLRSARFNGYDALKDGP